MYYRGRGGTTGGGISQEQSKEKIFLTDLESRKGKKGGQKNLKSGDEKKDRER